MPTPFVHFNAKYLEYHTQVETGYYFGFVHMQFCQTLDRGQRENSSVRSPLTGRDPVLSARYNTYSRRCAIDQRRGDDLRHFSPLTKNVRPAVAFELRT